MRFRHIESIFLAVAAAAIIRPASAHADWAGYETLNIPFHSAEFQQFQQGASQEKNIVQATGNLVGYVKVDAKSARPFVILLHGCVGLSANTVTGLQAWGEWFGAHGFGVMILDSYGPRQVKDSCGHPDGYWSHRRVDDIHSAAQFLIEKGWASADRIYVLGQSNGGRVAMNLASASQINRPIKFAGVISFYPYCGDDQQTEFFRPLLILAAEKDVANPPELCRRLERGNRLMLKPKVVFVPGATHAFDVDVARRDFSFNLDGRQVDTPEEYSPKGTKLAKEMIERFLSETNRYPANNKTKAK